MRAVIVGAGPAGLAAAHQLVERGVAPVVLEKGGTVGGLARTEAYKGYRYDIGGHRFYTKVAEIQQYWQQMLGESLLKVQRLSRIHYQGRFLTYPLNLLNVVSNVGLVESGRILLSYAQARARPYPDEETFERWLINHFGRRLYQTFFKSYTEKVWGISCDQLEAELAAQRIKSLSVMAVVASALFNTYEAKSLIHEFHYPVLGPGLLWQRLSEAVERGGGQVRLGSEAVRLVREPRRISGVVAVDGGSEHSLAADWVISSMPLAHLLARLDPPPPEDVAEAARGLRYRALIEVVLIVNRASLFPDNWIYVHDPQVRVGRIQNYKNWSAAMVPHPEKSSLGLEYFCDVGDGMWQMTDAELIGLATGELAGLGLADAAEVQDGVAIRQPHAYPVLDRQYPARLARVRRFLSTLDNLQTIGRNGMHRYNNMDHSMLTGMLAVRNLFGEQHDLWSVNTERSYYEAMPRRVGVEQSPLT